MTPKLLPDAKQRIKAVLRAYDGAAWVWGQADCISFAADAVRAFTGSEVLNQFRGKYSSQREARAIILARGCRSLSELVADLAIDAGFQSIPVWSARVGDVGVTAGDALCVRLPVGWVGRTESGQFALGEPVRAWATWLN